MNTSATKADTYELITNAIVEALETAGDWKRPWQRLCGSQPVNVTGRDYRGVNTLALWVAMETNGWQAPIFGTFRQWEPQWCSGRSWAGMVSQTKVATSRRSGRG